MRGKRGGILVRCFGSDLKEEEEESEETSVQVVSYEMNEDESRRVVPEVSPSEKSTGINNYYIILYYIILYYIILYYIILYYIILYYIILLTLHT